MGVGNLRFEGLIGFGLLSLGCFVIGRLIRDIHRDTCEIWEIHRRYSLVNFFGRNVARDNWLIMRDIYEIFTEIHLRYGR